jgi:hypothetical protein
MRKIRIVVGFRRVHAGSQPLNMNIAPSFLKELRITVIVDYVNINKEEEIVRDDLRSIPDLKRS